MPQLREWLQRYQWQLVAAVVVLNAFLRNGSTPLWDQDEAAYAGFARQMLASGDWVVPDFMWSAPHRKPPFLFWSIAVSFKLFGESEFALRLPSVLATLGTYLAVWRMGGALFGEKTARIATLILATSLFIPNLGKIAFTDSWLLLFETVAILSLFHVVQQPRWKWVALFWASVSLGVLTKGPPILIVTGGLFAWLLVVHPKRWNLLKAHPWFGLPLAIAPLILWGKLAWGRTNGDLIRWMLDWYVLHRAKGGIVFGQVGPPGYHLLVMLAGFLPWSLFLWSALGRIRERWRDDNGRFVLGWLLSGWIAWELMQSKLPAYALGAYPAIALLLADELARFEVTGWTRKSVRFGYFTGVLMGSVLTLGLVIFSVRFHLGTLAFVCACVLMVAFFASTQALFRALLHGQRPRLALTLAMGGLTSTFIIWWGLMPAVDRYRGLTRIIADSVAEMAAPETTIVYGHNFRLPSLPFYMGRTHHQQLTITGDDALRSRAAQNQRDVYVLPNDVYLRLKDELGLKAARRIEGWVIDGPKQVTYWIAMKDVGPTVAQP